MPEISEAEYRQYLSYQRLGTPQEIEQKRENLERDNKQQRDEIRDMRDKQPKEGQILVTQADVDELAKYKELGTPEDLTERLERAETAERELSTVRVRTAAQTFAQAAGLAPEAVDTLIAIPALQGAKFEVREAKNDEGKETQVAYITLDGENQKAMKYEDAIERIPALKGLRTATEESPRGTDFVPRGSTGNDKGGQDSVYDRIRKDAEARKKASTSHDDVAAKARERLGAAS